MCLSKKFLEHEIKYISTLLFHHNNDLFWGMDKVILEVKEKPTTTTSINDKNVNTSRLLYKGDEETNIVGSIQMYFRKLLTDESTIQV